MQSPINAPLPKLHGLDLKSMILTALQEIKQVCSILDDQIALWPSLRQVAFELGMRFYAFQDRKRVAKVSTGRSMPAKMDKSGKTFKSLDSSGI